MFVGTTWSLVSLGKVITWNNLEVFERGLHHRNGTLKVKGLQKPVTDMVFNWKRHEHCFVLVLQTVRNRKQNKNTSFVMLSDKPFVCKVIFFQKCWLQRHSNALSSIVLKYNRRAKSSRKKKKVAIKGANAIARTTNSPRHLLPLKMASQKRKDKLFPVSWAGRLFPEFLIPHCGVFLKTSVFRQVQVAHPSHWLMQQRNCSWVSYSFRYLTSHILLSLGLLRGFDGHPLITPPCSLFYFFHFAITLPSFCLLSLCHHFASKVMAKWKKGKSEKSDGKVNWWYHW